jgi:hypothetical protein
MGINKITHLEYICDIGRLDCWSAKEDNYYDNKPDAKNDGWTEKNGKVRCPMCTMREDKE